MKFQKSFIVGAAILITLQAVVAQASQTTLELVSLVDGQIVAVSNGSVYGPYDPTVDMPKSAMTSDESHYQRPGTPVGLPPQSHSVIAETAMSSQQLAGELKAMTRSSLDSFVVETKAIVDAGRVGVVGPISIIPIPVSVAKSVTATASAGGPPPKDPRLFYDFVTRREKSGLPIEDDDMDPTKNLTLLIELLQNKNTAFITTAGAATVLASTALLAGSRSSRVLRRVPVLAVVMASATALAGTASAGQVIEYTAVEGFDMESVQARVQSTGDISLLTENEVAVLEQIALQLF